MAKGPSGHVPLDAPVEMGGLDVELVVELYLLSAQEAALAPVEVHATEVVVVELRATIPEAGLPLWLVAVIASEEAGPTVTVVDLLMGTPPIVQLIVYVWGEVMLVAGVLLLMVP